MSVLQSKEFEAYLNDVSTFSTPEPIITSNDAMLEDTIVESVGRSFPLCSFRANKHKLKQHSKVVRSVMESEDSNSQRMLDTVVYNGTTNTLRLTDSGSRYNGVKTFKHMDADIIERFLQFISNDDILVKQVDLKQEIAKNYSLCDAGLESALDSVTKEYNDRLEQVMARKREEMRDMEHALTNAMEASIRSIKLNYENTLNIEKNKIEAAYSLQQKEIENYLATQTGKIHSPIYMRIYYIYIHYTQ